MEWWNYGALQIGSHFFLKFCQNYYFVCMSVSWRPEEDDESPGTRITELQMALNFHVGAGNQNQSSGIAVGLLTAEPFLQSQGKVLSGPGDSGMVFELVLTLWRD